ncbi:MAG: IclR family transcriptional regulator [Lautropia sp.]
MERRKRPQQGVQGVEIGMRVAFVIASHGEAMTLRDLAKAAGVGPSTAHRYLVSLCRAGMVEQHTDGRYDLGHGALTLGLSAQGRLDEYRIAGDVIDALHAETGLTVTVSAWGTHGPTIVRRKEPVRAVTVNTRVGSVMPVISSASGRVFAAFLPRAVVEPIVVNEFRAGVKATRFGKRLSRKAFDDVIDEIRAGALSAVQGDLLSGVDAFAAPVFDHERQVIMVIAILGTAGTVDLDMAGRHALALKRATERFSARLGFRVPLA